MADKDETMKTDEEEGLLPEDESSKGDEGTGTGGEGGGGEGEGGGEPGALDPGGYRFNQVWARYQQEKADAISERDKNIRLEERLRTLETKPTQTTQTAEITENDIQVAIESGDATSVAKTVSQYSVQEAKKAATATSQETDVQTRYVAQISKANAEIAEYVKIAPSLRTHDHPKWGAVQAAFREQVDEFGVPSDSRAELLALRAALGPLNDFKKTATRRPGTDQFAEFSGGTAGSTGTKTTGDDPFSRAPDNIKRYWEVRKSSHDEKLADMKYINPSRLKKA